MYQINQIQPEIFTAPADLSASIGKKVNLQGIIHKIRRMREFAFVLLRRREGLLQCVYCEEEAEFSLEQLQENMSVRLDGVVVAEERSSLGYEVRLIRAEILSVPAEPSPLVINNREVPASLETLLDYRPLTLRHPKEQAIFKIQAELCRGFRDFFDRNHFTEIHTPKIVSGSAEGGANVFRLDYFGKEAFLAQSPQFYKQMMVGVLERVYEIAPVFRAEKHDTSRHINEYTSIDLEIGFLNNYWELMQLETAMLSEVLASVKKNCFTELQLWNATVPTIESIPAIPFDQAKQMVSGYLQREITDPNDFDPEEEKILCEIIFRETGSELVFVTGYHSAKRPFYTMDSKEDSTKSESFDLLFRGIEITTGGQRIHSYHQQAEKMCVRGMNVEAFSGYLMAHKYGLPPHGGMGIGLERLTARLLGLENVRRATLFPRDTKRLVP